MIFFTATRATSEVQQHLGTMSEFDFEEPQDGTKKKKSTEGKARKSSSKKSASGPLKDCKIFVVCDNEEVLCLLIFR